MGKHRTCHFTYEVFLKIKHYNLSVALRKIFVSKLALLCWERSEENKLCHSCDTSKENRPRLGSVASLVISEPCLNMNPTVPDPSKYEVQALIQYLAVAINEMPTSIHCEIVSVDITVEIRDLVDLWRLRW